MRILVVGDIFAKAGRQAVHGLLPRLTAELTPDVIVANAENIAGGAGLTVETCKDMFAMGVHVLTTGNHVWDRREILPYIAHEPRLLRPLNFPPGTPGNGLIHLEAFDVTVLNLQGRVFMRPLDDPFRCMDAALEGLPGRFRIVDFHAEATAEKKAMGFYLDGRVGAVIGTHTHVQTADEQILPAGTAFISDVGMTGPVVSIIGNEPEGTLTRYVTQMPAKSMPAVGRSALCAVLIDLDGETGLARSVQRIFRPWPPASEPGSDGDA